MNIAELSPEERLIAEQAVLNLRTLNTAADAAADGTVFAVAEKLAVEQGRELTRKTLQATLNVQVKDVEKKSGAARVCECGLKKCHHGRRSRDVMSTAGRVRLSRIDLKCVECAEGGYVADDRLGIDGRYSVGTQRLACLAAVRWSYDMSALRLEELCGLRMADNTIRQIAQKHGAAMNIWQNSEPQACRDYREADGQLEFTTDGTCVNTTESWREMKVAIFSKRPQGESATAEEWSTRTLPGVTSQVAFAAIERSDRFGRRWKQWARRLGILETSNVTVLADGAKWIREEQQNPRRGATGVLDIFHAIEHIAETSRDVFGAETNEALEWLDKGRGILIAEGWAGISEWIVMTRGQVRSPRKRRIRSQRPSLFQRRNRP